MCWSGRSCDKAELQLSSKCSYKNIFSSPNNVKMHLSRHDRRIIVIISPLNTPLLCNFMTALISSSFICLSAGCLLFFYVWLYIFFLTDCYLGCFNVLSPWCLCVHGELFSFLSWTVAVHIHCLCFSQLRFYSVFWFKSPILNVRFWAVPGKMYASYTVMSM